MVSNGSLLDRIIDRIDAGKLKLPLHDPIALKMQELAANKADDIGAIEDLITQNQTLGIEVLRWANSPFYCGHSPIRTIRNAIVRLGSQQMRRLVILASEQKKYRAQHPDLNRMLRDLWYHVSTTALSAQWLSKRLRMRRIEEICFLGGMLHDIGKLIILRAVDEMQREPKMELALSPALLSEILATAHCPIGHKILKKWDMPDIYCEVAGDHHGGNVSRENIPMAIIRLANQASRKLSLSADAQSSADLAATPDAILLKVSEVPLTELHVLLEDHIAITA